MEGFKQKVALIALAALNVANAEAQDFQVEAVMAEPLASLDQAFHAIEGLKFEQTIEKLLKQETPVFVHKLRKLQMPAEEA